MDLGEPAIVLVLGMLVEMRVALKLIKGEIRHLKRQQVEHEKKDDRRFADFDPDASKGNVA